MRKNYLKLFVGVLIMLRGLLHAKTLLTNPNIGDAPPVLTAVLLILCVLYIGLGFYVVGSYKENNEQRR